MSRTTRPAPCRFRPTVESLEVRLTPTVDIRFDYTYDTSGFFNDPAARAALERVAGSVEAQLQDSLSALAPSGVNSWTATFRHPATGGMVSLTNPTVRQDEIVVYVGAAPKPMPQLGYASAGGFSAAGTQAWLDAVRGRGQAGALAANKTDFATWGGSITFNAAAPWHFGADAPAADRYDFDAVAAHELMHILGFGLGEPAFTRHVAGGLFVGPNVTAAAGGPVGVEGDPPDHFAPGTRIDGRTSPMVGVLQIGEERTLTRLDFAALKDIGWQTGPPGSMPAQSSPAAPSTPVAPSPVPPPPVGRFTVGVGAGVQPAAFGYTAAGRLATTGAPFAPTATGGVRVATADVNGDGVADTVYGTGPGGPSLVRVVDGKTGGDLYRFQPFESSFTGGVNVAAGDLNGDGKAEIVVTPDEGGGPRVQVYDGGTGRLLADLYGIDDPNFRGGARAAVGDVNGDGRLDLVVAAGYGGGPRVAVYDGRSVLAGRPAKLVNDFFAFEEGLRNGVFVAVADLDGDGFGDIICGAGPAGAPRVLAFGGGQLLLGRQSILFDLYAGGTDERGGVRVAALDVDEDGRAEVVTGSGPGGRGQVQVFSAGSLLSGSNAPALTLQHPDWVAPGVFVG